MSETAYKCMELGLCRESGVATLTFKAHTLTQAFFRELHEVLDGLERSEGPLCLVTTCANPRIYSAGLHLLIFQGHFDDVQAHIAELGRALARFQVLPFVTVAALNGHCIAGGLLLALAHDYRLLARGKGSLHMSEVNLGLPIPYNVLAPLVHKLSPALQRDMCLFGKPLGPDEALAGGVVDELVAPAELAQRARDLAQRLAPLAAHRDAVRGIKLSLYKSLVERAQRSDADEVGKRVMRARNPRL